MTHAYTAVMNGRDISHFLNIPKELVDSKILITVDPIEVPLSQTINNLQKLFANAHNIKIANEIQIDAQMEEINDALS